MYHVSDIRHWVQGIHLPGRDSIVRAEKVLASWRFWAGVGIVAVVIGLFALMIWAAQNADPDQTSRFYNPYFFPHGP